MNNKMQIEFKIKTQLGTKWENLPVLLRCENKSQIKNTVITIKEFYKCYEIRWNFINRYQGHYISGNVSRFDTTKKMNFIKYLETHEFEMKKFGPSLIQQVEDWLSNSHNNLSNFVDARKKFYLYRNLYLKKHRII